jgi:hypothetical protein
MSLVPTTGQSVLGDISTRLSSLATTLSTPASSKLVAPAAVSTELHDLADLTSVGLGELEFSSSARAAQMAPAIEDAMTGMGTLADSIAKDPATMTAPSTVDAISGWAQLTAGASSALHRL